MSNRIPPLLEPYVALPPPSSLILVTSVLGASANWLVLRHLYALLKLPHADAAATTASATAAAPSETEQADAAVGVALVSFLRPRAFWKEGCGKLGVDADALERSGRLRLVDGLEEGRALLGAGRGEEVAEALRRRVEGALAGVRAGRRVLVVDGLDVLVAMGGEEGLGGAVQGALLRLREHVHSTIVTLSADDPLLHAQQTTLEREHAALVAGLAHAADGWMGVRMLDTGVARDVSGVVRVGKGGADQGGEGGLRWEEREMLYHVGADGGVKVFERGT